MNDSEPIQPLMRTPTIPYRELGTWRPKKTLPEDYERDKTGKYAKYIQGINTPPISEFVEAIEPKMLSGDF